MLQYKIPQNVGIEDKIVGPLTLRQLIILSVGIGISYVLFAIFSKLYELNVFEYIVIALPVTVTALMALVKIRGITFTKYAMLVVEFSIKPKKRVWDHRGIAALVMPDLSDGSTSTKKAATQVQAGDKKMVNLASLSRTLDSGGFDHVETIEHKDIDSVHDDTLVQQAFLGHKESETEHMYWRTADSHKELLKAMATTPSSSSAIAVEAPVATTEAPKKKIRPRRKPAMPARPEVQVNTHNKEQPFTKKEVAPEPTVKKNNTGEFRLEELQKGEIEINLDD